MRLATPAWTLSNRMAPHCSLSRWLIKAPRILKSLAHFVLGQWYSACLSVGGRQQRRHFSSGGFHRRIRVMLGWCWTKTYERAIPDADSVPVEK